MLKTPRIKTCGECAAFDPGMPGVNGQPAICRLNPPVNINQYTAFYPFVTFAMKSCFQGVPKPVKKGKKNGKQNG